MEGTGREGRKGPKGEENGKERGRKSRPTFIFKKKN